MVEVVLGQRRCESIDRITSVGLRTVDQRGGVLRRNLAVLVGIFGLFVICNSPTESISLSPVYWNLSNPMFVST